jgi:hypothetical protein
VRIILDGTKRYFAACKTLSSAGFAAHRALKLLFCLKCKTFILPKDAPGHASDHDLKVEDKPAFMRACEQWKIHQTLAGVVHPNPRGPPVEGLAMDKGFACAMEPAGCAFACRSHEWMEKHVRAHPEHDPLLSNCYRSNVTIQTLFAHIGKKFFEVEPALRDIPPDDILTRLIQDFLPTLPAPSIPPSDNPNERDALLRLMQWDVYMEHYYTVPSKRAAILALKSPPRQADPAFQRLRVAMLDYVKLGMHVGKNVSPNLTVRKHLVQGRHLSTVPLSVFILSCMT